MSLALVLAVAALPAAPTPQQAADRRLREDWAWLGRYAAENAALAPTPDVPRVVFIGDSITEGWRSMVPGFFTPGRIGRGIGGQTSPQLLVRFRQDVIDLKPAAVHIMIGTNDIAANTGPMTPDQTKANIRSMTELAQANGIAVILASIPPADRFPWRPGLVTGPKIVALNAWLKAYAAEVGATYADYWQAMRDPDAGAGDGMRAAFTYDGVHPDKEGYAAIAPIADAAIKAALAPPERAVAGGTIRGERLADGTLVFRGVPFAAAPVGPLRFRAPQPVARWSGVRDATRSAPACPQRDYGWNAAAAARTAEDCLYLDVRAPAAAAARPLPVMVWIHGGANRAGGGAGTVDSRITDRGVVLVSVQYRLGALGFLSHPALTKEAGTSGNYALLDQQAALRWVQAEIAKFGGDPGNVTIFGESAGAQDVGLQLLSPGARGLFHKAIAESGTAGFGLPARSLAENERLGRLIAGKAGASAQSAAALRALPVEALIEASETVDVPGLDDDSFIWLQAIVDGETLPEAPAAIYARGGAAPVPLLIGVNAIELTLHGGMPNARSAVRTGYGRNGARALALYGLNGNATPPADPRLGDITLQIANDLTFRCPAIAVSNAHLRAGPVWQYQYDYTRPDGRPVAHADEVRYVFGAPGSDPAVEAGAPPLQAYWVNFAQTGDPNGAGLPTWARYTADGRAYMRFPNGGPAAAAGLRRELCDLREAY